MSVLLRSEKQPHPQFLWGARLSESSVALEKPALRAQVSVHARAEDVLFTMPNLNPGWQIRTDSISSKINSLFSRLQVQGVRVEQQMVVYEYLLRFPDMIEVVEETVFIAREHLQGAQFRLEVYHDPESEDEHLVLYARFPAYDKTVMERIRSARRRYRHLLLGKSRWFILTTDFKKPE